MLFAVLGAHFDARCEFVRICLGFFSFFLQTVLGDIGPFLVLLLHTRNWDLLLAGVLFLGGFHSMGMCWMGILGLGLGWEMGGIGGWMPRYWILDSYF